jgi:hypothetical protein
MAFARVNLPFVRAEWESISAEKNIPHAGIEPLNST